MTRDSLHDIINLTTAIALYTDEARSLIKKGNYESAEHHLKTVETIVKKLDRLVQQKRTTKY